MKTMGVKGTSKKKGAQSMSCEQSCHKHRRQILFLFRAVTFFLVYITTTPTDSIAAKASWRTSAASSERIVFQTGFEQNNLAVDISDFKLVDGVALKGRRSLMGQVTEAKQACFLSIPYTAREKRQVNVSFFVRTGSRGLAGPVQEISGFSSTRVQYSCYPRAFTII